MTLTVEDPSISPQLTLDCPEALIWPCLNLIPQLVSDVAIGPSLGLLDAPFVAFVRKWWNAVGH